MTEKNKRVIIVNVKSITNERRKNFISRILFKLGYDEVHLLIYKTNLIFDIKTIVGAYESCKLGEQQLLPDYYTENDMRDICDEIADCLNLPFKTDKRLSDMIIDSIIFEEEEKKKHEETDDTDNSNQPCDPADDIHSDNRKQGNTAGESHRDRTGSGVRNHNAYIGFSGD